MTEANYDACLVCLALERYQAETDMEVEALARLRYRFARSAPYAPFRTAEDWYNCQST